MPTHDDIFEIGTALGSGETDSHTVKQPGAASLSGIANRTGSGATYDLDIAWLNETGSTVETERLATNVANDTQTTFDVAARSPFASVEVADNGSTSGTYDLVAHFR